MAIVVEDGSIVYGANSYASVAVVVAYAQERGIAITEGDDLEADIVKAFDYINAKDHRYRGHRVERLQQSAFPRYNLLEEGFLYPINEVPPKIVDAQCELVIDLGADIDLYNRDFDSPIKRLVADTVELEFYAQARQSRRQDSRAEALLAQFYGGTTPSLIPLN